MKKDITEKQARAIENYYIGKRTSKNKPINISQK